MSAPTQSRTQPVRFPSQSEIAALESVRDDEIRAWLTGAIQRELPRIGKPPNDEKEWRLTRGIEDGEWMTSMKPQFETGMRPGPLLKDRIYDCGMLMTAN